MVLIITGGIGFLTWDDIKKNKWHVKKYRMQSKVILTVTGLLILLPAVYFFLRIFRFASAGTDMEFLVPVGYAENSRL